MRSWHHIQGEMIRRSLALWNQDQGKRGARNVNLGIVCIQMMVEGGGVDEIVKGKNAEETKGGRRRGKKRRSKTIAICALKLS